MKPKNLTSMAPKNNLTLPWVLLGGLLLGWPIGTLAIEFISPESQTTLVELYTSEGCSSCPPADHFVSQFKQTEGLWQTYLPLSFHVDYWDWLGWRDRFASADFSERQRTHHRQGALSSVYTPGFVINGAEWTGFFNTIRSLPQSEAKPGRLHLTVQKQQVLLTFQGNTERPLTYHLAVLGLGLSTAVQAGENRGHTLEHDFVMLHHQQTTGPGPAQFRLPLITQHDPEQFALVAWVSPTDSLRPIQAVGGPLPPGTLNRL